MAATAYLYDQFLQMLHINVSMCNLFPWAIQWLVAEGCLCANRKQLGNLRDGVHLAACYSLLLECGNQLLGFAFDRAS